MGYLTIHEPPINAEYLIMAFRGWPDAGEGASAAIRHLLKTLPARKFAELDSEEFYDFSQLRPYVRTAKQGRRVVTWPANEFFQWDSGGKTGSLLFFVGVEPNLKWKTFSRTIADAAKQWGVNTVVHIGSLLDAVPHTRAVRITGHSDREDLRDILGKLEVGPSDYQGPTGITSAVVEACTDSGLSYASLWGHTPHYLHAAPNYMVSHALITNLSRLLNLQISLDQLGAAAEAFEREVGSAVDRDDQIREYVDKLEQRHDETSISVSADMPQPAELVQELEEFLKDRQRHDGREGPAR